MSTPPVLVSQRVSWSRGGRLIVDDIELDVRRGELVGVLGPNGSGKSSLLRLLAGIRRPDRGTVLLDGVPVTTMPGKERARRLAIVAQDSTSDGDMTVLEVALLGRIPFRRGYQPATAQDRRIAADALAAVGLGNYVHRRWNSLSGGERQRVAIARALAQQPAELLLDEFTNHLDIHHQLAVLELVAASPMTVVAALHDLNLAASYCDRVVLLDAGRIVAAGPPAAVLTEERIEAVYHRRPRIDHLDGTIAIRFAPDRAAIAAACHADRIADHGDPPRPRSRGAPR